MLPIRDTVRSHSFPAVNWALIGANSAVFLYEAALSPARFNQLIAQYGLVPARLHLTDPQWVLTHPFALVTLFTSMFLHGGWFHVISNMWFLYIFGDNVEDRMGSLRYLAFYLASGLVAALAQTLVLPNSQLPTIGASGAIEIPAIFYLGFWFLSQLFSGISILSLSSAANMGGIAWWAHIGGFVFGMIFYRFFTHSRQQSFTRRYPNEYQPW
jgi:membrane associated rhomboid family serine protease